jgi:hypothetical protein
VTSQAISISRPLASPFAGERAALPLAGILTMGFLAAFFLAWPVFRAASPLQINFNESWNAWFIDAILSGVPLYPGPDELIVNNYPPLSFYILALVAKLTGDTIFAGRLLSLVSTGVIGIAVALCVRALGGLRLSAVFGGLWCVATLGCFFSRYVGTNDPNLLALAAMGLSLALFLSSLSKGRSVAPAIMCMVLSGFIKHSLIAIPLAAMIWLVWSERRQALRALLLGAFLCALGLLICRLVYGANFLTEMLMPREMTLAHVFTTLGKIQWIAPALLFWALWAWPNRGGQAARFTGVLMGTSLLSNVLQALGAGVSINSLFELVFASGIGVALAVEGMGGAPLAKRFGERSIQSAMLAILVLRFVLWTEMEPYLLLTSPAFHQELRLNRAAMEEEIRRIEAIPGRAVWCSNSTVCYRAGKALVYDEFWASQMIRTGKRTKMAIDQAIGDRGIRFEMIAANASRAKKRLF